MTQLTRKRIHTVVLIAAGLLAAIAIAVLAVLISQVEDWRRDLTTNFAQTDDRSPDQRLRPLRASLAPPGLADRLVEAMQPLTNWHLESRTDESNRIDLHFVRTTPVMRFKDDIRVRIEADSAGGSVLNVQSRSRVGKGDLGQNPRNLRELLAAVRGAAG